MWTAMDMKIMKSRFFQLGVNMIKWGLITVYLQFLAVLIGNTMINQWI